MKNFKHYITEVLSWKNNSLFAVFPSGDLVFKHSTPERPVGEHPDEFPSLNFSATVNFRGGGFTQLEAPRARAWGRIDHENKTMHIITEYGMKPSRETRRWALENDVFKRMDALSVLEKKYPDYKIHHGYEGEHGVNRQPRLISPDQYRKELTDMLAVEP